MIITLEEIWTLDCPWLNETGVNKNLFTLTLETRTFWIRLFGILRLYPFLEKRVFRIAYAQICQEKVNTYIYFSAVNLNFNVFVHELLFQILYR